MIKHLNSFLTRSAALSLALFVCGGFVMSHPAGAFSGKNQSRLGVSAVVIMSHTASALTSKELSDVGLRGFDPVTYRTDGAAVTGHADIEAVWRGVTYRFADEFNRSIFLAEPWAFLPQFDGDCAFGAAMGRKIKGNPSAWAAHDGKIYFFNNERVKRIWQKNINTNIARAGANWPSIR